MCGPGIEPLVFRLEVEIYSYITNDQMQIKFNYHVCWMYGSGYTTIAVAMGDNVRQAAGGTI